MMITNLVSTITQSLSQDAIGAIASSLELDETAVQRGINTGIPGILAGLANAASTPSGAQKLGAVVSQIQDLRAQDIVKHLLGADQRKLALPGWAMLSSLLGAGFLETLSSVIAQYCSLDQRGAKDLLGLQAPLVLGFLRREQIALGLDSRGLASLLANKRDNIRRAVPAEMATRLQDSGVRRASQLTPEHFRGSPALAPQESSDSWALWLLPLLIIAGVAIYLLPAREDRRTVQDTANNTTTIVKSVPAAQPEPAPAAPAAAEPAAAMVENGILANIARLRASLQTIEDPATAQAALGEIKDISSEFSRLKALARQLSPEARKALAAAVARRVPDLNRLIDRIGTSQTELGGESKPAMDSLKSQLASIAKV